MMELGIVGLGRIGGGLAVRALERGHRVVGYNRTPDKAARLTPQGLQPASSLDELVSELAVPRSILVYLPAGEPTEDACARLAERLELGDAVADGGNSHWLDSQRRQRDFEARGVRFLDVGTSGGVSGAKHGPCFMVGGVREDYDFLAPLLIDLAIDDRACTHVGPPGAGHFAKLVHNAIEFGMVQAIGEGVELLERSDFDFDLVELFANWERGSVIRGWLVELMREAFERTPNLAELSTYVEDTGEVKWILTWALARDVPAPVTSTAQQALMQYRDQESSAAKAVALLRAGYGGHPVHRKRIS